MGSEAMLTIGLFSGRSTVEPTNGASPKAKMPPSDATKQQPFGGGTQSTNSSLDVPPPLTLARTRDRPVTNDTNVKRAVPPVVVTVNGEPTSVAVPAAATKPSRPTAQYTPLPLLAKPSTMLLGSPTSPKVAASPLGVTWPSVFTIQQ